MKYLIFLFISINLFACTDANTERTNITSAQIDTNKTAAAPAIIRSREDSLHIQSVSSGEFAAFWPVFRRAVLSKDTLTVLQMTQFPFETRGELDEDPVVKYKQADFLRVYHVLLGQWTGLSISGKEFDLIRTTTNTESIQPTADWARVGAMEFRKINGQWKLAFAYLTEESIEKLQK